MRETLGCEIPAVILTGDISTDTMREIAQGGYVHLNKPVKAEELTHLIQSLLAELQAPSARAAVAAERRIEMRHATADHLRGRR